MPNVWHEFPELIQEPFLAINVANSTPKRRKKNEGLLERWQTGDWVLPAGALDAGLEGTLVALLFARATKRTLYLGRIAQSRKNGQDARGRSRYRLTVEQGWREIRPVDCSSFSQFFRGIMLNAAPVAIWIGDDALLLQPGLDTHESDPLHESELLEQPQLEPLLAGNMLGLAQLRVGHNVFVQRITARWGMSCALTGIAEPGLVQACHIRPWSACDDMPEARTDVDNGLPLCVHLHYALDHFLISFTNDGELLVAREVDTALRQLILAQNARQLRLAPTTGQQHYLEWHRAQAQARQRTLLGVV